MPRSWHDWFAANEIEDPKKRELYRSIVADRKPYFMRYIYPSLMKQYNTYIRNTNKNCLREFQMTIDELQALPYKDLTDEQKEFLRQYNKRMPVGTGDCVMNKICRRIEEEFDGFVKKASENSKFDYTIMKSGAQYTQAQYRSVLSLYENYNRQLKSCVASARVEREDPYDTLRILDELRDDFERLCLDVCSNSKVLCDILLDICYSKSSTKKFVWDVCASDIVKNLLEANGGLISYPSLWEEGTKTYCGERYDIFTTFYNGGDYDYIE